MSPLCSCTKFQNVPSLYNGEYSDVKYSLLIILFIHLNIILITLSVFEKTPFLSTAISCLSGLLSINILVGG